MRKNKTRYSILGILSLKPMSGYEIKKTMEKSIGYFWQESYGQIYPTLKELTEEELLLPKTKLQVKGVEKIVYSITPKGEIELNNWLKEEVETLTYRNELLLKLFFGKKSSVPNNILHLENQKKKTNIILEKYKLILNETINKFSKNKNLPYWLFTVKYGIKILTAEIEWIEETKKEILKLK